MNTLGRSTPLDRVWGVIKRMSGNKREYGYPIMKEGEKIIVESNGKAELLARTFVKIHSNGNLSNEEKIQRENTIRDSVKVRQDDGDNESTINVMFTMGELNNVFKKNWEKQCQGMTK